MKIVVVGTNLNIDMYICFSGCIAQNAVMPCILTSTAGLLWQKCGASFHLAIYWQNENIDGMHILGMYAHLTGNAGKNSMKLLA